jgi:hypothetical protein
MKPQPTLRPFSIFLPVLLTAALLAGCNLPGNLTPLPTSTSTELPSPTPQPPQDTPTPLPPTPTLEPTATATQKAVNLVFSTGATAGVATGTLQPGQTQSYTLNASQNQPMILILTSSRGDVYLGVTQPDGTLLLDPAKKWTNFQWLLPKTGTYTIQVYGGASAEDYTLTVKVAQVVTFASGSNSATLTGSTVNGFVVSYALYCTSGQTMSASLNLPSSSAYLDVFGLATGPLLSSGAKANNWSGVLPSSQDYIVEVIPAAGQVTSYSLAVSCH